MKKVIFLFLFLFLFGFVSASFSGDGDGSSDSAYLITNCTQLQEMNDNLSAYYELSNDINCSNTSTLNDGAGFEPIGDGVTSSSNFSGVFDGKGYIISNLYINRTPEFYVGLFSSVSGNILNVGIVNVNISGGTRTGSLVGHLNEGNVSGISVYGTINSSGSEIGGLIGRQDGGLISNCYSFVNVTASENVGGLIGGCHGNVSNSFSVGIVENTSSIGGVGGLVGSIGGENITDSYYDKITSGQNDTGKGIGLSGDEIKLFRNI